MLPLLSKYSINGFPPWPAVSLLSAPSSSANSTVNANRFPRGMVGSPLADDFAFIRWITACRFRALSCFSSVIYSNGICGPSDCFFSCSCSAFALILLRSSYLVWLVFSSSACFCCWTTQLCWSSNLWSRQKILPHNGHFERASFWQFSVWLESDTGNKKAQSSLILCSVFWGFSELLRASEQTTWRWSAQKNLLQSLHSKEKNSFWLQPGSSQWCPTVLSCILIIN